MKTTAVLILAAGASKRMGTAKQLLPYKHTTLLGATIEEVLALKNTDVYVVLGARSDAVSTSIAAYPVTTLVHLEWEQGLGASLAFGVKNLQGYDRILVVLADQPFINKRHYQNLLSKSLESKESLVATEFQDLVSVPAVFTEPYFTALMQCTGGKGARSLFVKHKNQLSTVQLPEVYRDIDLPEDYKKLLEEGGQTD